MGGWRREKKETRKQHPDHMHHQQREYSCLLGALDEMGLGFSTCLYRSLPNPKLNTPPTHNKAPLSSPLFPLSAMLPNTYSVTHSLLARLLLAHWMPSTEQQCMKHKSHHELNSRAGMGRQLQEVNKHCSKPMRKGLCATCLLNKQGIIASTEENLSSSHAFAVNHTWKYCVVLLPADFLHLILLITA